MGDSKQLFESLFRPKIGPEGEVDFLKQLTSEHPYFSPAQFFLLQRTSETDTDFAHQAARTAVLFNNPFWLNFQLLEAQEKLAQVNHFESLAGPIPNSTDRGIIEHEDSRSAMESGIQPGNEVSDEGTSPIQHDQHELQVADSETSGQEEIVEQEGIIDPGMSIDPPVEVEADTENSFVEDYPEVETQLPTAAIEEEQNILAPAATELAAPDPTFDEVALVSENNEAPPEDDEPALDPEEQKELEPLNVRLNIVEPTTTEETISFEPLHTTDYFASQGIRLSNDVKSTDKLGKQLKSFTEWLKTMKKVHPGQPADSVDQTDVTIQKLAEKSNDEDEVVTEAMADVLIQQGKSGKAREVYRKLSLLNPAKTAYFAAKIDQLKEQ